MSAVQQLLFATGGAVVYLPTSLEAVASAESYYAGDQGLPILLGGEASASIAINLRTNGSLNFSYGAVGDVRDPAFTQISTYTWLRTGVASNFSARMRLVAGSFSVGSSSVNTWIPITSDIPWNLASYSNNSQPSDVKAVRAVLEIAYTNNLSTILSSSIVDLQTSATTFIGVAP